MKKALYVTPHYIHLKMDGIRYGVELVEIDPQQHTVRKLADIFSKEESHSTIYFRSGPYFLKPQHVLELLKIFELDPQLLLRYGGCLEIKFEA